MQVPARVTIELRRLRRNAAGIQKSGFQSDGLQRVQLRIGGEGFRGIQGYGLRCGSRAPGCFGHRAEGCLG